MWDERGEVQDEVRSVFRALVGGEGCGLESVEPTTVDARVFGRRGDRGVGGRERPALDLAERALVPP